VTATKAKLSFRFHNPNTDDETLKLLTRFFTETSQVRFEEMLQKSVITKPVATPKIEEEPY